MSYTIGPFHNVTGSGEFTVANLAGLQVLTTQVPASSGVQVGHPPRYFGLGRVAVGNSDGWSSPISIVHIPQLVYPVADGASKVGYSLALGTNVTITELRAVASPLVRDQPWDRGPSTVQRNYATQVFPPNSQQQVWFYQVPAGRKLLVAHMHASIQRAIAPPAAAYVSAWIEVAGVVTVQAFLSSAVLGVEQSDELATGPLVLLAGTLVRGLFVGTESGGQVNVSINLTGTEFDA